MTFRKESKLRLSQSDLSFVKQKLLTFGFKNLYPSRRVNSCYFDTDDYKFFQNSEEGIMPRKKTRIRWYNSQNIFNKETKISSIEGRYKITSKIFYNSIDEIIIDKIKDLEFGLLKPAVLVCYDREYYSLDQIRLTIDMNLQYTLLRSLTKPSLFDTESVIEFKTSIEVDDSFILNEFGFIPSRFSKYSRGLLKFHELIK